MKRPRSCSEHPVVRSYLRARGITGSCVGWGYKRSGLWARKKARLTGRALYLFEDAPVRSLKPGYGGAVYGVTVDRKGAMFDARGESSLLDRLNTGVKVADDTAALLKRVRELGVSKYNWHVFYSPEDLAQFRPGVLLVDQTRGDTALGYAGVTEDCFSRMMSEVLVETPEGVPIYLKTHPDAIHKAKKSCFPPEVHRHPRVQVLPPDLPLAQAFTFCSTVYVASSLVGMEALIHGRKVRAYGWNFYTGWGLTEDRGKGGCPPRCRPSTLLELFQAYYLDYCYYMDPNTGCETGLGEILDHLEFQRLQWQRLAGRFHYTQHLSPWHKRLLGRFLESPYVEIGGGGRENRAGSRALSWGVRAPLGDNTVRVEDGFIRSRGLGANFCYPLSLILDDKGVYFDYRSESRLECILNEGGRTQAELQEARSLQEFLVENHITKYRVESVADCEVLSEEAQRARSEGRTLMLVPGQVDSDMSIMCSSPEFQTNAAFVAHLRETYPEAYLLYKPHPDLLSRSRSDAPFWQGMRECCDEVVMNGDVISWIQAVDEVHTMTSTVGMEALLHRKKVFTYGVPFYAGWGLTIDYLPTVHRVRDVSLTELICAAYVLYPVYKNPNTGEGITALQAAKLLQNPTFQFPQPPFLLRVLAVLKQWRNRIL